MAENPTQPADELVDRLVDQLESVRDSCADVGEDQRRQALRNSLQQGLGGLSDEEAERLLRAVRNRLIDEARQQHDRLAQSDKELAQLREQLDSIGLERDRLAQEVQRLSSSKGAIPAAASDAAGLEKFREGLIRITEGQAVSADSLGLPPGDARMFRLFQELLQFALRYEEGVNLLLGTVGVGPAAGMDTQMIQGLRQVVRDRFRACLENKDGSLEGLKETLNRNSQFVIRLHGAYSDSLHSGTRALLGELDPQPILDDSKRMMGFNFEEAWKAIARIQGDLANLSKGEMWERFFSESFRDKLSAFVDEAEGTSS